MTPAARLFRAVLVLGFALAAGEAYPAAGTIQFASGEVLIRDAAGRARFAVKGGSIEEGETILTRGGASVQVKMSDGGVLAVRPDTELKIDTYRFRGREDGSENAVMSLLKGGFRTITGIIGRRNKDNYRINTPVATIGIRGTDHEPHYVPPVAPGAPRPPIPPGAYDKVNVGVAFIRTPLGQVNIQANQIGFAALNQAPALLPVMPEIFKATPPVRSTQQRQDRQAERGQQAARDDKPPAQPAPVRDTAIVDPAPSAGAAVGATTGSAAGAVTQAVNETVTRAAPLPVEQSISGLGGGNLSLNLTEQTITTSAGVTVPLQQGAFALQAQEAANLAAAAANALNAQVTNAGPTVSSSVIASVVGGSSTAVGNAQTAVSAAQALSLATAVAGSTMAAGSAAGSATTALNQVNAAQAAFTANGSFADASAGPAMSTASGANAALQTANTSVQGALATLNTAAGSLAAAQAAAAPALGGASTALASAQASLAALAPSLQTSTASAQLVIAQNAAGAAQSAANQALVLQNAGDFAGAEQKMLIAQQQAVLAANALSAANAMIAGITQGNLAAGLAGTAANEAGNAQTAYSSGIAADGAVAVGKATVDTKAALVASAAPVAAYSNPAVASGNFGHAVMNQKLVAGGTENVPVGNTLNLPNTSYVLDGNKDLVELRNTRYERYGLNYVAQSPIADADVKFSGGVAKDHYQDAGGVAYLGRWEGGQMDVSDNASVVAPFSQPLGATSAHWFIGLLPGNSVLVSTTQGPVNNVQTLQGTASYGLVAATQPTDSAGNAGTLASASLTANFSSQTVDASLGVNFATRSFGMSATRVPIGKDGFDAYPGTPYAPVVTCSGAGCTAAYLGHIGGAFLASASGGTTAGALGTGLGIAYGIYPDNASPAPTQPYGDYIHGVALMSTAAAPVPGLTLGFPTANVQYRSHFPISDPGGATYIGVLGSGITLNNAANTPSVFPGTLTGLTVKENFLFNTQENLIRAFDVPFAVFDHGVDVANPGGFALPTPLAHAMVSYGGGGSTHAESFYHADSGTRFGRWAGNGTGFITITDLMTGKGYVQDLGNRSIDWIVHSRPVGLPVGGAFHFTRIADGLGNPGFATRPHDAYGNVGTLDGARLTVDFNAMKVDLGLRVSFAAGPNAGANLAARANGVPISGGGVFNVSTASNPAVNPSFPALLNVSCFGAGCAPGQTYTGRVRGEFTGATTANPWELGAYLRYSFNTSYADAPAAAANGRIFDDYITGLVAFKNGTSLGEAPVQFGLPSFDISSGTNPPGEALVQWAYSFNQPPIQQHSAGTRAHGLGGYGVDALGNLTGATSAEGGNSEQIAITGGVSPVNATAPNGIVHGYVLQDGSLNVSGTDFNGPFTARQPIGALHWIRGPDAFPFFAAEAGLNPLNSVVASFPVAYAQLGGFVTDQNGTLGSASGSLSVDFNRQAVNATVNAAISAGNFAAVANNLSMDGGEGSFQAWSFGPPKRSFTSLNFTPTAGGPLVANGNLRGALMGEGLSGAGMVFDFSSSAGPERATGSLVFGNPTYNDGVSPTTPFKADPFMAYRLLLTSSGMSPLGAQTKDGTPWIPGGPLISEEHNYKVEIGVLNADRTQFVHHDTVAPVNPQGALVKFDAPHEFAFNGCISPPDCWNQNRLPARYALADATGGGPTVTNLPLTPPTAKSVEFGYDATTGLRWGRWGGGFINVGDRNSPSQAGAVPNANNTATTNQIDLSANHWHYLVSTAQSGPVVLPVSGTGNYTLVGNTSPTAFTPGQSTPDVGTLGSASLTANFTAKTVDVAVTAGTPLSGNWSASATGVPIQFGTGFFVEKRLDGTGPLAVTRNLSPTGTAGTIGGVFTGQTGGGAGIAYSLNQGGPAGVTISGVAAFKRN